MVTVGIDDIIGPASEYSGKKAYRLPVKLCGTIFVTNSVDGCQAFYATLLLLCPAGMLAVENAAHAYCLYVGCAYGS